MRWYTKCREREKARRRYDSKTAHKATDLLRCESYQRTIDKEKKYRKRKGKGRAYKVKGQTMPTQLCANSRYTKAQKHRNGRPMRGESMRVAIMYSRS